MRKTLLFLAAFVVSLAAGAQNFKPLHIEGSLQLQSHSTSKPAKSVNRSAVAKAPLASNQRLVGAYTTDDADIALGLGRYVTGTIEPGVLLTPSDYQQYADAKVVAVRFALGADATASGVAVYGVNSDGNLSEITSVDASIVSQSTENEDYSLNPVWNTVELPADKQFTLSSNYAGYLVSYKVNQESNTYPIAANSNVTDHTMYVYTNINNQGERWYGVSSYAPAIQLIVEGDFPANGLTPTSFGKFSVGKNGSKTVRVTFLNLGTSLSSFAYTYTINGVQSEEKTLTLRSPLGNGGSITGQINFQAPATAGTYPVALNVTKVNGVDNGATTKTANGTMIVVSKEVQRHVVMEEYTGTGCGWCPRGLVSMKNLATTYGDNFIGIGVHQFNSTDAMYNTSYGNVGFSGSAPACILDRDGNEIDPYNISYYIDDRLADLPLAGVSVKGSYSADSTQVLATATFDPVASGNYEVAYVVTADGLTGTTAAWAQSNYYSSVYGQFNSASDLPEDLQFLYSEGGTYFPEFNDVLIGSSYNGSNNQAGTVSLTDGTLVENNYTTTLINGANPSSVKAALKYDKVNIIALLIDPTTGNIVNAAKAPVTAYVNPTGIKAISNSDETSEPVTIYTVSGQKVDALQHGLNIVKYANGKSVKVLKK